VNWEIISQTILPHSKAHCPEEMLNRHKSFLQEKIKLRKLHVRSSTSISTKDVNIFLLNEPNGNGNSGIWTRKRAFNSLSAKINPRACMTTMKPQTKNLLKMNRFVAISLKNHCRQIGILMVAFCFQSLFHGFQTSMSLR
jgi:hypothetical protein